MSATIPFSHTVYVKCARCGQRSLFHRALLGCPQCGGDWLDGDYDYARVRDTWSTALRDRPFNLWRYRELLPLGNHAHLVTMGEGGTPLLHARNLGMMLGCPHIYVKDERQMPTGSFKDRQASVAVSVMKEQDVTEAVVASTGNVAISYSAYSALAGIKLWAFVTSLVPAEKMREVALYGSEVVKVTATYDEAKKIAAQFAERKALYLDRGIRSVATRESMKTLAYEVAEQLPRYLGPVQGKPWRAPDWYFQAVSGGMGPVGVWRGFEDLRLMGLVDRAPRLACIQAEGCAPMVHSFAKGLEVAEPVVVPQTLITTVATGNPGPAYTFLQRVIRQNGGAFEAVSDEESFRAMHVMAKLDGLSMEAAAAMAFAGLFKLVSKGIVQRDEVIVVNCSGHTFPVEKYLLGDEWARTVEVPRPEVAARPEQEGLLGSLERLDQRVQRVAIVEDNPDAARLLRRILQTRGNYQIFEAYDGNEGLALIRRERPDLVLLDLMMPGVDGFGVLEQMKSDEDLRTIPVIVITAKELTAAERQRLSGQISLLLQKGTFMDDELLQEILDAIG